MLPPGADVLEGNWRHVRPEPGYAIVNLGDAMVEWSGGILRSNMHRVTFPPGAQKDLLRHSLLYSLRAEANVLMRRLVGYGNLIPSLEDGEEEIDCSAEEWEKRKIMSLVRGDTVMKSRGGALITAF